MAVFHMHSFNQGGLFWAPGVVGTERIPKPGKILFAKGAIWLDAKDNNFIDGYVSVSELRPFTFPIGDNGNYRPIALSNAKGADAAYFGVNPSNAVTSRLFGGEFPILPFSGPFESSSHAESVNRVSEKEYWDINGDQFSFITLTWDDSSDIAGLTENNLDQLGIVGWNGSEWEYIPSLVDESALSIESAIPSYLDNSTINTSGSITTAIPIVPDQYEVYTFGCIADKSNAILALKVLEDSGINEFCLDSIFPEISNFDSIVLCNDLTNHKIELDNECILFEPELNQNGIENVCIQVIGTNNVDTIDLAITIVPVNDPPFAVRDSFKIDNSFELVLDILSNDSDIDGDVLTLGDILIHPNFGELDESNGYLIYRPSSEFIGFDSLLYEVCDQEYCDSTWVIIEVNNINGDEMTCVEISTHIYLEGAYDLTTNQMEVLLNERRYLPGQEPFTFFGSTYPAGQPYDIPPWLYDGTEGELLEAGQVNSDDAGYDESVVDYVLVSVRSANTDISTQCRQVGLLYSDGTIRFFEDTPCCMLDRNRSYFILIEHRNHLPTMSSFPMPIINDSLIFDFRFQDSYIEALGLGQKEVDDGIFVMYGGNGDQGIGLSSRVDINVRDLGAWLVDDGLNSSYYIMDFDLNGDVNVQDKGLLLPNIGVFTDVAF